MHSMLKRSRRCVNSLMTKKPKTTQTFVILRTVIQICSLNSKARISLCFLTWNATTITKSTTSNNVTALMLIKLKLLIARPSKKCKTCTVKSFQMLKLKLQNVNKRLTNNTERTLIKKIESSKLQQPSTHLIWLLAMPSIKRRLEISCKWIANKMTAWLVT